ncbi:MAG TPA: hypothetical protein PKD28_02755 [Candidatus Saccharibacteria bacterium]|nr:hypothetical protein [Candidatus Saccharibacteria bacterium]
MKERVGGNMSARKSNRLVLVIAIVIAVAGVGAATYFYLQNERIKKDPSVLAEATQSAATEEAKALKEKVAKLMQLPSDENPVVATVSDKEKLKDQAFFKDAENGDRILIFTEAKKAVIYREKDNRLINVGPIAVTSDSAAAKVSVSILASKGADNTAATESKLSSIATSLTVTKGVATATYSETKVYDASGKHSELAAKIAELTGGEVVTAPPAGETAPEGAQVIIFTAR